MGVVCTGMDGKRRGAGLPFFDDGMDMESISPDLKRLIDGIPAMHGALQIEFADVSRLADMQLGYGMDVTGRDLSGTKEGDWRAEWLVFGYDYGDPVFVDRREKARGFPVYVAEHGTGRWEPQEIADSLAGLTQILLALNAAMHAGNMHDKKLAAEMAAHAKNPDYWDGVIEEIEDRLE